MIKKIILLISLLFCISWYPQYRSEKEFIRLTLLSYGFKMNPNREFFVEFRNINNPIMVFFFWDTEGGVHYLGIGEKGKIEFNICYKSLSDKYDYIIYYHVVNYSGLKAGACKGSS